MANEAVKTAVLQMGMDPGSYAAGAEQVDRANQKILESSERVVVAEERVTAATRTTADGFARLEARYDPLIRAEQRREAALAQANRYLQEGIVTQERHAAQIMRVNTFYDAQVAAIQRTVAANGNFGAAAAANTNVMSRYGNTIRQAGFQVGDFAVQMASGTNPMVAFTQQGSQLIQMFGPLGAVAGAALSIFGALAVGFMKAGESAADSEKATSDYQKALGTLNSVMLASADAAKIKETADRAEAAAILDKTQALKQEEAAQKAARAAAGSDMESSGSRTRGRIRAALNESVGTTVDASYADPLSKLKADLFTAREDARELQEQIDALNSGVNLSEIFKQGDSFRDYRENLELQVRLSAMATDEAKIQGELAKARKEYNLEIGSALDRQVEALLRQKAANEEIKKADEERLKFTTKIVEMLNEDERRADEAASKRNTSVEKYISGLEAAAQQESLSTAEKETARAILEAQNKLIDEQGQKLRDLTEDERARIENAVRLKNEIEDQRKAAEKVEKDLERSIERGTDRGVDRAADILYDGMQGKITDVGTLIKNTLLRAVADATAEAVFRPIIQPVVSSFVNGGGAGGAGGGGGDWFGWVYRLLGVGGGSDVSALPGGMGSVDYAPFANGAAFHGGVKKFARGGIVNRPTLFPMANGAGLMGEAGPEAVMPLARDGSGRLGVRAGGGGGMSITNVFEVNVTVSGDGGRGNNGAAGNQQNIGKEIARQLEGMVVDVLQKQMRAGNVLNPGI